MKHKYALMLTGAFIATGIVASAQVTTSGIRGTVKDEQNTIVPGAIGIYTVKENGQTVFPKEAFMKSVNSSSTWGMQIGLRYTF